MTNVMRWHRHSTGRWCDVVTCQAGTVVYGDISWRMGTFFSSNGHRYLDLELVTALRVAVVYASRYLAVVLVLGCELACWWRRNSNRYM
jgi:hypothetical protein